MFRAQLSYRRKQQSEDVFLCIYLVSTVAPKIFEWNENKAFIFYFDQNAMQHIRSDGTVTSSKKPNWGNCDYGL